MPNTKPKTQSKSATVIALLDRGKGTSIDEICKADQWQAHGVRAFLTGLRKKSYVKTREQRGDEGTSAPMAGKVAVHFPRMGFSLKN